MEANHEENMENENFQKVNENEYLPINMNNKTYINKLKNSIYNKNDDCLLYMIITLIIIILLLFIFTMFILNSKHGKNKKLININKKQNKTNVVIKKDIQNIEKNNIIEIKSKRNVDEKIGIVFIIESIFGNGIGRMISLLLNEIIKDENNKYKLFLITDKIFDSDFEIDKDIQRLPIYENKKLISELDKKENIQYYVLNNVISLEKINFYLSFNKKVININHGSYLSSIYTNNGGVYKSWKNNLLYDAFISLVPDDYYIYKNLGMKNTFYIPNLYTFDPSKTPTSNLTYNNIIVMGRENDPVKGGIYAIKVLNILVRLIPDVKLYFISSDNRIERIIKLIKEFDLEHNVEIIPFVTNITEYFLNSSVLLYPSLSESFPMVMNEGKAHGLPIVAFNISYSVPYQDGVILVDMFDIKEMAIKTGQLLKDYNYRKREGEKAKLSLNRYSKSETLNKWNKLFFILNKDDPIAYQKLQEYTYEKYYDEEKAKNRLESNYNFAKKYNEIFECHTFNNMTNLTYISELKSCLEIN